MTMKKIGSEGQSVEWVSKMPERDLRDALEVRIGLVSDRSARQLLRGVFADKSVLKRFFEAPCETHPWVGGVAERTVEICRMVGAAAGSLPFVDRDLVTTAGILQGVRDALGVDPVDAHRFAEAIGGAAAIAPIQAKMWQCISVICESEGVRPALSEALVLRHSRIMSEAVARTVVVSARADRVAEGGAKVSSLGGEVPA